MVPLPRLIEQVLLPYGGLALLVALLATPLAAAIARGLDVMDHPDRRLKPHAKPIPYLGGLAIWLGWTIALVAIANASPIAPGGVLAALILGGAGFTVIGVFDDARHLPPRVRLAAGASVVAIVAVLSGLGQGLVNHCAGLVGVELPWVVARWIAAGFSVVVVLGACNSANLIDGLDGLAAGTIAIVSLGFFALAAAIASRVLQPLDVTRLALAAAMAGAALGFLFWNYNPARIFMGDAGSLLLGYNSGLLILLAGDAGLVWFLAALAVFFLPIYDTTLAIGRRWWNRKPIFEGDRSHFYDQLRDRGLSVRQTGAVCYGLAAVFAICGLAPVWLTLPQVVGLYAGLLAATLVVTFAAGLVRVDRG